MVLVFLVCFCFSFVLTVHAIFFAGPAWMWRFLLTQIGTIHCTELLKTLFYTVKNKLFRLHVIKTPQVTSVSEFFFFSAGGRVKHRGNLFSADQTALSRRLLLSTTWLDYYSTRQPETTTTAKADVVSIMRWGRQLWSQYAPHAYSTIVQIYVTRDLPFMNDTASY